MAFIVVATSTQRSPLNAKSRADREESRQDKQPAEDNQEAGRPQQTPKTLFFQRLRESYGMAML